MFSSGSDNVVVTPHKIALLVLIKNYADISDGRKEGHIRIIWHDDELVSKRRLNRTLLTWIQQPDGTLKNILHVVGCCSRVLHSTLCSSLQNLCDLDDPQMLEDFFAELSALITDPSEDNLLQRGGILGLFCRRMVLYYEKLSFCRLRPLHDNLTRYCSSLLSKRPSMHRKEPFHHDSAVDDEGEDNRSDSFDEMELESQSELDSKSSEESAMGGELKPSDLKTSGKSDDPELSEVFTSRQADFFFAQQAALITEKETMAMPPAKLQNKISQILRNNPQLTEAHYLSYLNCLRVREFCGSVDCLLTYFNRHPGLPGSGDPGNGADDDGRVNRYAALNLALLHYRFGHRTAALAAVKEAVSLCQLAADTQCLQHAVALMAELDPDKVHLSLLEDQVKPMLQMNLTHLAATVIQRDTNQRSLLGDRPRGVFLRLTASETLARSKLVQSLTPTSYIHKGALWRMYGKRHMSALYCQLALTYQGSSRKGPNLFPWQPNSAEIALSLCHFVELLHEAGDIPASQEVLRHLKQRYPRMTEHSPLWQMTELRLRHKTALRNNKCMEATQIEREMIAFDEQEAEFRTAERMHIIGESLQAHTHLQEILKDADEYDLRPLEEGRVCTPELQCKAYLLLGQVMFNEECGNSGSLEYVIKALSTANRYYLHGLAVQAKMLLTQLQLFFGMPSRASYTLESCTNECLANGSLMDISRLRLIQAKCIIALVKETNIQLLNDIIALVYDAKKGFDSLQDLHYQKAAVYLLARLYHEKSILASSKPSTSDAAPSKIISMRDKYAAEFKQLDASTFYSFSTLLI